METLNKTTLAEQAYQALRERILSGGLAGGARLQPEELAADMQISPTPIKEALVRLEAEGLLAGVLRHGVTVRRFSTVEIIEFYEARLLVERHAVLSGLAAGRVTAVYLAKLRASFDAHLAACAVAAPRIGEVLMLDRAFHAQLVALAANDVIAGWHHRVMEQTHTVHVHWRDSYAFARVRGEHTAILEALAQGDAAAAAAAITTHLDLSRGNLLSRAGDAPAAS